MSQKPLPKPQFDNVVRWIRTADRDRLRQLRVMLDLHAGRLGLRRFVSRRRASLTAPAGIPPGSDHFDSGSLNEWASSVIAGDSEAIGQVASMLATLIDRMGE